MPARFVSKLKRDEMERRRLAAGRDLLREGDKWGAQTKIAHKYGVSCPTVGRWKKIVERDGLDGLRERPAPGASPRLTPGRREKLRTMLIEGALAHGFETDVWTGKHVSRLIRDKFGVEYNWKYVPQLLHEQLGLSWQKPNRRPRELDETKVAKWLTEVWEPVKKGRSKTSGRSGSSTSPERT
jgi:transposase